MKINIVFQTYLIAAGAQVFWRDPEYATDASTSISAIQEFIKHHLNVDYLMSFKLRWKEEGNKITSENFNPESRPRRQNWNGELIENGMFYLASRKLIEKNLLQDDSCSVVEIPAKYSLEIDTPWDLELAQNIAKYFDEE
ncbi:N-acylneuraminate cytidylyltransferase A-like [Ctenocephalides felis]|uniref:N-acylneuraminate cytidylyltransferase A-like n=1 Tax=Ctenocephalides felis TaxID=7515 RepID=UPI000E6E5A51|nr:N-acylneuraminate cytidylyltransferase A-like [Ctenocephalides felis]XP_026475697.1 N-acylneuraminate cytidylyltransferase A-like [Ctenocephalides felis]